MRGYRVKDIIAAVDCRTCGAEAGEHCFVNSRKKPGFKYQTLSYTHAIRAGDYKRLQVELTDQCLGKYFDPQNDLCMNKCEEFKDCRAIFQGEMSYEDRYRDRKRHETKSQCFALVEIMSVMFTKTWDARVQAIPGRLRGEQGEG